MAKHTPGPWMLDSEDIRARIMDATCWTLARCFFRDQVSDEAGDEHNANALLIAAAPDLLAACEAVVADWETAQPPYRAFGPVVEQCKVAIAKATGEEAQP